jgi:hypothetical protein
VISRPGVQPLATPSRRGFSREPRPGTIIGMVQKQVTAQEWMGSTPAGRRPRIRFSLRSRRPGGSGNHGPNQLLSGRVRPVLNGRPVQKSSRFSCFRTTTAAVAGHGSNAGHRSGVAEIDARKATPPDPSLARWGLASCCQLDLSHPALVAREDPGAEPCMIACGSSLFLSPLAAWPVLRCSPLERPGIGSARLASNATNCYVFPVFCQLVLPQVLNS